MTGNCKCYFPGGNTPEGFVSYYGDILSQEFAERIFCIKGGPGTGKSTLMKKIGDHYLNKGSSIECLKCSSDPYSLDGVVIKERNIAILDGTAPHITDPVNPGAIDEIVDLGKHFNDDKLIKNRRAISQLSNEISETFKHAYIYLKCAQIYGQGSAQLLSKYIVDDEVVEFQYDMEPPKKPFNKGRRRRCFGSAVSSAGIVNELSGLADGIEKVYLLDVPAEYDTSRVIKALSQKLIYYGYDVQEMYCPMSPATAPEHLLSYDAGCAVFTCNEYHGKELLDRNGSKEIIKVEHKSINDSEGEVLEDLRKAYGTGLQKAVSLLKKAKTLHDELENHYIEAMDFTVMDDVEKEIINKIEELTG